GPLALALCDLSRQAGGTTALGHSHWALSDFEPALEGGLRALDLARRSGVVPSLRVAALVVGQARLALGEYEAAITHLAANVEMEAADPSLRGQRAGPAIVSVIT